MKKHSLLPIVLAAVLLAAPGAPALLGENSCLGESFLDAGSRHVGGELSREGLPDSGEAWLERAAEFFVAPSAVGNVATHGLRTLGAAEAPRYIPGYGYIGPKYTKLVRQLQAGESIQAKNLRFVAELRRDAFPGLTRSRYRGPLSEAPSMRGTYDWHDPARMIHPGPHQQIVTPEGQIIRIEVPR
jgi:hypothetical protein